MNCISACSTPEQPTSTQVRTINCWLQSVVRCFSLDSPSFQWGQSTVTAWAVRTFHSYSVDSQLLQSGQSGQSTATVRAVKTVHCYSQGSQDVPLLQSGQSECSTVTARTAHCYSQGSQDVPLLQRGQSTVTVRAVRTFHCYSEDSPLLQSGHSTVTVRTVHCYSQGSQDIPLLQSGHSTVTVRSHNTQLSLSLTNLSTCSIFHILVLVVSFSVLSTNAKVANTLKFGFHSSKVLISLNNMNNFQPCT